MGWNAGENGHAPQIIMLLIIVNNKQDKQTHHHNEENRGNWSSHIQATKATDSAFPTYLSTCKVWSFFIILHPSSITIHGQ